MRRLEPARHIIPDAGTVLVPGIFGGKRVESKQIQRRLKDASRVGYKRTSPAAWSRTGGGRPSVVPRSMENGLVGDGCDNGGGRRPSFGRPDF